MILNFYRKISCESLDIIYKKTVADITDWFDKNPKRRICRAVWVYGENFKVRKNHIKEDIEKMYKKTKLDAFKNSL